MSKLWECKPNVRLCMESGKAFRGSRQGGGHDHPFHEMGFVLSGACTWHLTGHKPVPATQDEGILVPRGCAHYEVTPREGASIAWIGFEFHEDTEPDDFNQWTCRLIKVGSAAPAIRELLKKTQTELHEGLLGSSLRISMALQEIFLLLSREESESFVPPETTLSKHQLQVVTAAAHYIRKNYRHPLRIEEVAKRFFLCPAHFSTLFRRHHGVPPRQYLNQIRIRRVCDLLDDGDLTLKEIAEQTGFNEAAHLCRRFKEKMGVTPRQFQKEVKTG